MSAMSAAQDCACACPDPTVTLVPGSPGENGADGVDGVNAFTETTQSFIIPAIDANVTVNVESSDWMTIGQEVAIEGAGDAGRAGTFFVVSKPSATSVSLRYENFYVNTETGVSVPAGSQVSPSGVQSPLASGLPSLLLVYPSGTPSNQIQPTAGIYNMTIPHSFASGTSAGEVVTEIVIGHAFRIIGWYFVADVPGVGASASRVFNMEINTTNVGTVTSTVTATEASTSAKGEVTLGTTVTGANEGSNADTFSIEVAAGGTQFSAGSGYFVVKIQNVDDSNAYATFVSYIDDLIEALGG